RRHTMRNNIILSSALALFAACGGAPKGSVYASGGKNAPPPPPDLAAHGSDVAEPGKPGQPVNQKVEVSADAKKDYAAAMENFRNTDKSGWNESACKSSADRFASVVKEHSDLVAAQFMVGLSYQRCGMNAEAEGAYQQASRMKGDATKIAMALSNL